MGELAVRPVLDTDVLIDYLRGSGPGRDLLETLLAGLAYRVTAISAFELALGASYAADPSPVRALVSVPCLPLDRRAGTRAGAMLQGLRARGQDIGMRDAMQAAICLEADLPLVTRNARHFERIDQLDALHPDEWRVRHSG
ncbi:MAG: type II toxin-antitoxin system VapC family toxin [Thermoleophilaceae bacterium]